MVWFMLYFRVCEAYQLIYICTFIASLLHLPRLFQTLLYIVPYPVKPCSNQLTHADCSCCFYPIFNSSTSHPMKNYFLLQYCRATSRNRVLRLEVIWSTVSRKEADAFLLPPGYVVERSQAKLSQFETFRALWDQDERRKSVREEWALLSGGAED